VRNRVQDLETELGDLARPKQDREWFQQRKHFCEAFLFRFPQEDKLMTENMRRGWAESLFALGETSRVEESFRGWLQEDRRWSWGWIGWADNYLFAPPAQRNLTRAEQILQEGLAVEGIEEKEVFYERLAGLDQSATPELDCS